MGALRRTSAHMEPKQEAAGVLIVAGAKVDLSLIMPPTQFSESWPTHLFKA